MTDEVRHVLTEEERARIHAARARGGMCALCGRSLSEGEPVWMEQVEIRDDYGGMTCWRVPVGAECASPASRAAADGKEPERCAACSRAVYYQTAHPRRRTVLCSRRCAGRRHSARAKEATGA